MGLMNSHWKPSGVGRLLTRSPDWELSLSSSQFQLTVGRQKHSGALIDLGRLHISPGAIWSGVSVPLAGGAVASLDGIPNADAKEMAQAIAQAISRVRIAELI